MRNSDGPERPKRLLCGASGNVEASHGITTHGDPNTFANATLNVPLVEGVLALRGVIYDDHRGGYIDNLPSTYSIDDIARYYRTYLELMRHWSAALPGRILKVQHEDVVEDLESNVRRILDYCGLPFEPACLEFHKTVRSVRTASSEQVRQPIFRQGLEQWRNYEPWLAPLEQALGDALRRYNE